MTGRNALAARLRQAERDVAEGERHIEQQRRILDQLERAGHPTDNARDLLRTFETMQRLRVEDRDRLADQLRTRP